MAMTKKERAEMEQLRANMDRKYLDQMDALHHLRLELTRKYAMDLARIDRQIAEEA